MQFHIPNLIGPIDITASLLRTIFASFACANELVHVLNVKDFPLARLDSEINARFLLMLPIFFIA